VRELQARQTASHPPIRSAPRALRVNQQASEYLTSGQVRDFLGSQLGDQNTRRANSKSLIWHMYGYDHFCTTRQENVMSSITASAMRPWST